MSLIPKIDFCINNKCNLIDIYEQTNPFVTTTHETGWGNSNIDTSNITNANLTIYDYTGNTLLNTIILYNGTINVYTGVAGSPTPATFLAIKDYSWNNSDGVYYLVYTIEDGDNTYVNKPQYKLITCNIENCIEDLKLKMVTECDSKKLSNLKDSYDQLDLILFGIQTAFSCADFEKVTNLISSANTICDNLCDCGCGDC